MPRGNGFTRRGLFGAGAAGAVAAGLSACGDDYFDPATSHGTDVPNIILIFTDSTRADFIGHYTRRLEDTVTSYVETALPLIRSCTTMATFVNRSPS